MCVPKMWLLGSQSTCIVSFGFPTMSVPILEDLSTLLFPQTLLFTSQSRYLFLLEWLLSSLNVLSRIIHPPPPFLILGYDKWRCYDYSPLLVRMGVHAPNQVKNDRRGLLEVFKLVQSYSALGPKLGPEVSGLRLEVQEWG